MKAMIIERLAALREVMKRERLDAFIFPSTDPHHGEYVPDHWKGREFISGFNGSAGTAVVTMQEAALWTDSRYFLAAEEQLRGTSFVLMKQGMEGTPSIAEWLGQKLSAINGAEVGMDGMVNDASSVEQMKMDLRRQGGITLRTNFDPLALIWKDRPELPPAPIVVHPLDYAGESAAHKIGRVREALRERRVYGMLVSALDDIAWLLNLRGADVHCNPVFVSYLLLTQETATLFVDRSKLTIQAEVQLERSGVKVDDYNRVAAALCDYGEYNILMDKGETAYTLYQKAACQEKVGASPIPAMKAVKNEAEIAGYRRSMLRDGVAMVQFLRWLKPAVEAGGETEISIDRKLTALRAEQECFRDISFDTIAGYQAHGAIVHYEATPETDIPLCPEGLLLLDSGAQYADGTTDITRTIALGPVTEEQRHVYTLVLKGHIQLSLLKFPKGASGTQLDALARKDLWREGMNYMHGTGHGVGSYLNVHEGPHQIRMEWKPTPLVAGMTVTNEPGLYLAGKFGVRIENTMIIEPYMKTSFGEFLQLQPLTLCPIDKAPIDVQLLTDEELQWLNDYHDRVYEELSPLLDEAHRLWLQEATSPLARG
ncbi:MAG: aminopeptidase P family protein [Prevotella sp.]|nr:aminopeptidase P family protein [Prevotella sp.]